MNSKSSKEFFRLGLSITLLSQAMDKHQRRVISAVLALNFGEKFTDLEFNDFNDFNEFSTSNSFYCFVSIHKVAANSLAEVWNRRFPGRAVRKGHRLVKVAFRALYFEAENVEENHTAIERHDSHDTCIHSIKYD